MDKPTIKRFDNRYRKPRLLVISEDDVLLSAANETGNTWYVYDLNHNTGCKIVTIDTDDLETVKVILVRLYEERVNKPQGHMVSIYRDEEAIQRLENKEPIEERDGNSDGSNKTPMT